MQQIVDFMQISGHTFEPVFDDPPSPGVPA